MPRYGVGEYLRHLIWCVIKTVSSTCWKITAQTLRRSLHKVREPRYKFKRVLPDLFEQAQIAPIHDYPARLFDMLVSPSPREIDAAGCGGINVGILIQPTLNTRFGAANGC